MASPDDDLLFETDHAIAWRLTPAVRTALHERRIGIRDPSAFDHIVFPKSVTLEGYCSFLNHPEFYDLGAFSYVESNAYFGRIHIGRYCSIASDVEAFGERHPIEWVTQSMLTYDFGYPGIAMAHHDFGGGLPAPAYFPDRFGEVITIGHDVWIGRHVQLARGITIGHGAVIAAGSVVTKDVAPYTVVGGVPAKTIRPRFPEPVAQALLDSRWWDYPPTALYAFDFTNPVEFCRRLEDAKHAGTIQPFQTLTTTAFDLRDAISLSSPFRGDADSAPAERGEGSQATSSEHPHLNTVRSPLPALLRTPPSPLQGKGEVKPLLSKASSTPAPGS